MTPNSHTPEDFDVRQNPNYKPYIYIGSAIGTRLLGAVNSKDLKICYWSFLLMRKFLKKNEKFPIADPIYIC